MSARAGGPAPCACGSVLRSSPMRAHVAVADDGCAEVHYSVCLECGHACGTVLLRGHYSGFEAAGDPASIVAAAQHAAR